MLVGEMLVKDQPVEFGGEGRLDGERMDKAAVDGQSPERSDVFDLDVVGIGALNLDYIANVSALTPRPASQPWAARIADLFVADDVPFEWGTERSVNEQTIYRALEEANAVSLDAALGGSAFNAIFSLAQMKLGLRLGYVGTAGRVPLPGMSSVQQLDAVGVDHRYVKRDGSRLCGICFSIQEDGDRTLLTHAGANAHMADYLDEAFDELVDYLAGSRIVHVTSFLDDATAYQLHAVLAAVKVASPSTLLSFDPGHVWSSAPTPQIEAIASLSDFLLLNYREFTELCGHVAGEPDEAVADRVLRRFNAEMTVVVKRVDGVFSFRLDGERVVREFFPQQPLPSEEIEDSTGAGDVFAAGLLAVVASDQLRVELGSLLGMELARHKLRYVGTRGHGGFADIAHRFIRSRDEQRRGTVRPPGVFVAHGGDLQWRAIKSFIEDECRLRVYTFESGIWGSTQVTEALNEYLDKCSFAVCVLTAEDLSADGRRWARQNVVHEVGLFQGRYGFDRVMLLAEEGCDFVPDTAEPFTVTFPRNGIESTFWRLNKMIKSQGFDMGQRRQGKN